MKRIVLIGALCLTVVAGRPALAEESATPQEAYARVVSAAAYLSKTGEDGIEALGDADKGFVWKDSYVWVARCESNSCIPNPKSKAARLQITEAKCFKTGKLYILDLCDRVDEPGGAWTVYYRQNPQTKKAQRMAAYMRQVPGQPFQVIASVIDDHTPVADLEKISRP
jgi:hypothetical protein